MLHAPRPPADATGDAPGDAIGDATGGATGDAIGVWAPVARVASAASVDATRNSLRERVGMVFSLGVVRVIPHVHLTPRRRDRPESAAVPRNTPEIDPHPHRPRSVLEEIHRPARVARARATDSCTVPARPSAP